MKIKKLAFAAVLAAAVAACSTDVTTPAVRATAAPHANADGSPTTTATDTVPRDAGLIGSGGGR